MHFAYSGGVTSIDRVLQPTHGGRFHSVGRPTDRHTQVEAARRAAPTTADAGPLMMWQRHFHFPRSILRCEPCTVVPVCQDSSNQEQSAPKLTSASLVASRGDFASPPLLTVASRLPPPEQPISGGLCQDRSSHKPASQSLPLGLQLHRSAHRDAAERVKQFSLIPVQCCTKYSASGPDFAYEAVVPIAPLQCSDKRFQRNHRGIEGDAALRPHPWISSSAFEESPTCESTLCQRTTASRASMIDRMRSHCHAHWLSPPIFSRRVSAEEVPRLDGSEARVKSAPFSPLGESEWKPAAAATLAARSTYERFDGATGLLEVPAFTLNGGGTVAPPSGRAARYEALLRRRWVVPADVIRRPLLRVEGSTLSLFPPARSSQNNRTKAAAPAEFRPLPRPEFPSSSTTKRGGNVLPVTLKWLSLAMRSPAAVFARSFPNLLRSVCAHLRTCLAEYPASPPSACGEEDSDVTAATKFLLTHGPPLCCKQPVSVVARIATTVLFSTVDVWRAGVVGPQHCTSASNGAHVADTAVAAPASVGTGHLSQDAESKEALAQIYVAFPQLQRDEDVHQALLQSALEESRLRPVSYPASCCRIDQRTGFASLQFRHIESTDLPAAHLSLRQLRSSAGEGRYASHSSAELENQDRPTTEPSEPSLYHTLAAALVVSSCPPPAPRSLAQPAFLALVVPCPPVVFSSLVAVVAMVEAVFRFAERRASPRSTTPRALPSVTVICVDEELPIISDWLAQFRQRAHLSVSPFHTSRRSDASLEDNPAAPPAVSPASIAIVSSRATQCALAATAAGSIALPQAVAGSTAAAFLVSHLLMDDLAGQLLPLRADVRLLCSASVATTEVGPATSSLPGVLHSLHLDAVHHVRDTYRLFGGAALVAITPEPSGSERLLTAVDIAVKACFESQVLPLAVQQFQKLQRLLQFAQRISYEQQQALWAVEEGLRFWLEAYAGHVRTQHLSQILEASAALHHLMVAAKRAMESSCAAEGAVPTDGEGTLCAHLEGIHVCFALYDAVAHDGAVYALMLGKHWASSSAVADGSCAQQQPTAAAFRTPLVTQVASMIRATTASTDCAIHQQRVAWLDEVVGALCLDVCVLCFADSVRAKVMSACLHRKSAIVTAAVERDGRPSTLFWQGMQVASVERRDLSRSAEASRPSFVNPVTSVGIALCDATVVANCDWSESTMCQLVQCATGQSSLHPEKRVLILDDSLDNAWTLCSKFARCFDWPVGTLVPISE